MIKTFDEICRDYLAFRGESPDFLPLLEEGEESAVLTLRRALETLLPSLLIEATMQTPLEKLDVIKSAPRQMTRFDEHCYRLRLPDDYLRFHSLKMSTWTESCRRIEPSGSLRAYLRGMAPSWMICRHRPMITEGRDEDGAYLLVYGTEGDATMETMLYIPRPELRDGCVEISAAAYEYLFPHSLYVSGNNTA